jgi:uncharacterized membrane protein YhfC
MRLLGVRAIAISCLVMLGVLGCAEVGLAIVTREQVNRPTVWLLLSCAAVQIVGCLCGICGFKNLNRECMKWFFLILLIRRGLRRTSNIAVVVRHSPLAPVLCFLSSSGLVYVVVSAYTALRESENDHPQNILLVFGIALISAFFMYSSLLFGAIFYCKRRGAFHEADRAAEVPAQFSDFRSRRPNRRPGRAREYTARSAL